MPPFQMPTPPSAPVQPTGSAPAFPAELQMSAPSPEAVDPHEALLKKIQDFNDAANQLQTQQTMNKQVAESGQADAAKQALEVLKGLGVNPNDPQSITKYLTRLEAQEPDMAELTKKALYGIFGGGPQPQSTGNSSQTAEGEPQF